jgi:hypothetical protein
MFPLPIKINLNPAEAEMREGGKENGAPKENTVQSDAGSRHQGNLNIPRTGVGMGTTGGVVTVVRAGQRSTVLIQMRRFAMLHEGQNNKTDYELWLSNLN